MTITRKTVADKLAAYLHHRLSLAQLVDWAEQAMMDGDFIGTRSRATGQDMLEVAGYESK